MTDMIWDANSWWARSWFAASQSSGRDDPEKAIHFALNTLFGLLFEEKLGFHFNRTFFAWDCKQIPRKKRKLKPPAYHESKEKLMKLLIALIGAQNFSHPSYEADDIVATAVFNAPPEHQIVVFSGDKDLMQLQGGNVAYYCLNSKSMVPTRTICHKFAIKRPSQVAIALAIIGDRGDGISGIPKWGPKKVEKLFKAVTEAVNFESALATIQAQIPEDLLPFFLDSLDKTLLFNDVPGVPEPSELRFCSSRELLALGIKEIAQGYERVARQYEDGEATLDEMLRSSRAPAAQPE